MEILSPADLNILLVEPSSMQQKVILRELQNAGITKVDACGGKADALEMITRSRPDLVISSLHFDDGTGLELLREIRHSPELEDLPFMLVSSETRRQQLEEFKQSGVVAILPKPFDHNHLTRAINATLDLMSSHDVQLELYDLDTLRVLVVDDSRLARKSVMRVLSNLGIEQITEAADGSEAIPLLQQHTFDLVVTDYNMPEVNGLELTEFIRHNEALSHLPVLMVTSEASDAHLRNVAQAGVNAMADKPFETEEIKRLLVSILNG